MQEDAALWCGQRKHVQQRRTEVKKKQQAVVQEGKGLVMTPGGFIWASIWDGFLMRSDVLETSVALRNTHSLSHCVARKA